MLPAKAISANHAGETLQKKVYAKVNATHAHERKLKKPKTLYGHKVTAYALKQWTLKEALWRRRLFNPHWVLPAVMPAGTIGTFECVIRRESQWQVNAYNSTPVNGLHAQGLLQILGGPMTVWGNLMLGRQMYNSRHFQPWSADGIPGIPTCGIP